MNLPPIQTIYSPGNEERQYLLVRLIWKHESLGGYMRSWYGSAGHGAKGPFVRFVEGFGQWEMSWVDHGKTPRESIEAAIATVTSAREVEIARRGQPDSQTTVFVTSGDPRVLDRLSEAAFRREERLENWWLRFPWLRVVINQRKRRAARKVLLGHGVGCDLDPAVWWTWRARFARMRFVARRFLRLHVRLSNHVGH